VVWKFAVNLPKPGEGMAKIRAKKTALRNRKIFN